MYWKVNAQVCVSCGIRESPVWRPDDLTGQKRCYTCDTHHMVYERELPHGLQEGGRDESNKEACPMFPVMMSC